MDTPKETIFHGTVIHSTSPTNLHILPNTLLAISPAGRIMAITPNTNPIDIPSTLSSPNLPATCKVTYLTCTQFLILGLIDTHNHAPQWLTRGLGQGLHILSWLREVTFPAEARYADPAHARASHTALVSGMLRQGVTTGSYYSSLHGPATRALADTCLRLGQRALIGKCNMDRGGECGYVEHSAAESIQSTRERIAYVRSLDPSDERVRPVLTPRFAISCSARLLRGLGHLAAEEEVVGRDLPIQTHFNEDLWSDGPACAAGLWDRALSDGEYDDWRRVYARAGAGVS